ncbi:MAG: hypothetical protein HY960_08725 [Ignavibacteriae bacterium]|nr:hypothetical protein [Ignavibacteriota bacterium]
MLKYSNDKSRPNPLLYISLLFIAVLSSWQCFEVPPDPVLPTWDTQLSIPLIDTIFYLNDALEENPDIITVGPNYHYRPNQFKFDSVGIGDKLVMHPEPSITLEQGIGEMKVNTNQPLGFKFSAETLLGFPPPNTSSPVPPFSYNSGGNDSINLGELFYSVHFTQGTLTLQVRNSLPVEMNFPNGIELGGIQFPQFNVPANSAYISSPASLVNRRFFENRMLIYGMLESPGSGGNSVFIHADSGVTVSLQITNGVADEITAKSFERLNYSTVFRPYLVDDSSYFQHVSLKKGGFRLEVENTLEVGIQTRISMEEFVDTTTNQPFQLDLSLNKQSTFSQTYDLTKWKIEALNGLSQTATCSLRVTSASLNSSTPITIRAGDKVKLRLIAIDTPYVIKRIAGVSRPIWLNIKDTVDIDVGKFSSNFSADSVKFDSTNFTMTLNLFSAVGHPIDVDFSLVGINAIGTIINSMKVKPDGRSYYPNMRRLLPDSVESVTFSNLAQFVSDFLTKKGKQIIIRGNALVNPPDVYASRQIGSAEDTTSFYSSLDISALMKIGIFNGTFADTIDLDDNGEEKIDKDILTKIKQASVFFKIENAIPMGVSLHTSFLNVNNNSILSLPKFNEMPISIQAGTRDVPTITPSPIRVSVQTSDADKFNDTKRVIVRLVLNSNSVPTAFTTGDYIRVRAYANIVANINTK